MRDIRELALSHFGFREIALLLRPVVMHPQSRFHRSSLHRSGPGFLPAPRLALLALGRSLLFTPRLVSSLFKVHIPILERSGAIWKATQRRRTVRFVSLRLDAGHAESCSENLYHDPVILPL
jgi:hypothetical protein